MFSRLLVAWQNIAKEWVYKYTVYMYKSSAHILSSGFSVGGTLNPTYVGGAMI